jgi:very-short-patch-repair endonuclease
VSASKGQRAADLIRRRDGKATGQELKAHCTQHELRRALVTGGTVHADLGDRRRLIAIEADSFEHHGSRGALRAGCRRYDEMTRAGWTVLRFAWEHVVGDPQWVVAVVRDVCAAVDRRLAQSF